MYSGRRLVWRFDDYTAACARSLSRTRSAPISPITRKLKEALAAVAIDKEFSKEDIITMYLNQIFYGQRSYGIEAAANTYFNKHASELNLAEASLLAGLPQAPSYYDPTVRFDQAKIRQKYVLDQMVKYGLHHPERSGRAASTSRLDPQTRNGAVLGTPRTSRIMSRTFIEEHGPARSTTAGSRSRPLSTSNYKNRPNSMSATASPRSLGTTAITVRWSPSRRGADEILAMVGSTSFDDPFIGGQVNYAVGSPSQVPRSNRSFMPPHSRAVGIRAPSSSMDR